MNTRFLLASFLLAAAAASPAFGHGEAIRVEPVGGKLVVSNGVLDSGGFVDRIFVEDDGDGDPLGVGSLSGFGPAVYWNVPGFELVGLAENSGLYLDVLARPVAGATPAKERVLWYWNPTTAAIEDAPDDNHFQIRKSALSNRILSGSQSTPPAPLKIANPAASDMGFHNHTLLLFAIHRQVLPPAGAYGFFARLTSDQYAPSDPFLILVNNDFVEGEQMIAAAQAINRAADDAATLDGDFNLDGRVDAADYTVWRNGLGATFTQQQYAVWKANFGASGGAAALANFAQVPEPTLIALAAGALLALLPRRAKRYRSK